MVDAVRRRPLPPFSEEGPGHWGARQRPPPLGGGLRAADGSPRQASPPPLRTGRMVLRALRARSGQAIPGKGRSPQPASPRWRIAPAPPRGRCWAPSVRPLTPLHAPAAEAQEGVKTENDHINLKVAGQDGSVVQFKIKRHTPLNKLMKAYCERQGLSMRQIRFRFDGQPINETDTPAQLEMEDEDTIDVFQQQTGGAC
ncbi:small ubiquitin-related modifier 3 isoform X1 [Monodelphis domestica]|uniref:small ubiquitin-related modifier 3 isoform X1 n=1 Tax=Monodelphis domestica TaxID=13616 RepID=UPI0024E2349A|nr:small ubiquitin-related modifier 3 isoform X1 [Monodelphis domestica]